MANLFSHESDNYLDIEICYQNHGFLHMWKFNSYFKTWNYIYYLTHLIYWVENLIYWIRAFFLNHHTKNRVLTFENENELYENLLPALKRSL